MKYPYGKCGDRYVVATVSPLFNDASTQLLNGKSLEKSQDDSYSCGVTNSFEVSYPASQRFDPQSHGVLHTENKSAHHIISAAASFVRRRWIIMASGCGMFMITALLLGGTLLRDSNLNDSSALLMRSDDSENQCERDYSQKTLKLAHEQSIFTLFEDSKDMRKFEASDIVADDGALYAVCDSSYALTRTDYALEPFGKNNFLIGPPKRDADSESDWEALYHDHEMGVFYVVREAILHEESEGVPVRRGVNIEGKKVKGGHYHATIEELTVDGRQYRIGDSCRTQVTFTAGNKGFEGIVGIRDATGEMYLIGLCEGNHCEGGARGRDRGNGRMIMMRKERNDSGCMWRTVKILKLPEEVRFHDYSSVTLRGNRIAVVSQEDSRLWIGKLSIGENIQDGSSSVPKVHMNNPLSLEVLPGGQVLHFPRDSDCKIMYCNIEGIAFLSDRLLAAASDKMKASQDHRCMQKDQSFHVFSLPANIDY